MAELRGRARHQVAQDLAARFRHSPGSIAALAQQVGRSPRQVRRLLIEAGVRTGGTTCLSMPEPELGAALARRYRDGVSIARLRQDTGLTRRDVEQLLLNRGLRLRTHHPIPADQVAWAVQQYQNGVTLRGLATLTGASYGSVRTTLLDNGVIMRTPAAGQRTSS